MTRLCAFIECGGRGKSILGEASPTNRSTCFKSFDLELGHNENQSIEFDSQPNVSAEWEGLILGIQEVLMSNSSSYTLQWLIFW